MAGVVCLATLSTVVFLATLSCSHGVRVGDAGFVWHDLQPESGCRFEIFSYCSHVFQVEHGQEALDETLSVEGYKTGEDSFHSILKKFQMGDQTEEIQRDPKLIEESALITQIRPVEDVEEKNEDVEDASGEQDNGEEDESLESGSTDISSDEWEGAVESGDEVKKEDEWTVDSSLESEENKDYIGKEISTGIEKVAVAGVVRSKLSNKARSSVGIQKGEGDSGRKARASRRNLLARDAGKKRSSSVTQKERTVQGIDANDFSMMLEKFSLPASISESDAMETTSPIARCLSSAIREARFSISPDAPQISSKCQSQVFQFYLEKANDLRVNLPLLAACSADLTSNGVCARAGKIAANVMSCLKFKKQFLRPMCQTAVSKHQVESGEDISLDPVLEVACHLDRKRVCSAAGWNNGAAKVCLEDHIAISSDTVPGDNAKSDEPEVSDKCKLALYYRQMEDSEDIRYDYHLARSCMADKANLCPDEEPGKQDVVACLERRRHDSHLSEVCKSALERLALLRASDMRLDYRFRHACAADLEALCEARPLAAHSAGSADNESGTERRRLMAGSLFKRSNVESAKDDGPLERFGAFVPVNITSMKEEGQRLFDCARSKLESLTNGTCKNVVFSFMLATFQDSRLDPTLSRVCATDAEQLRCRHPAELFQCLRDHVENHRALSPECYDMVKVRMHEQATHYEFDPSVARSCVAERTRFCSSEHLSGAGVFDCLVDLRQHPDFGEGCRDALMKRMAAAVSDIRMLSSLKADCSADVKGLCPDVSPGKGQLLSCLKDKRTAITSTACKKQIMRLLGFAVDDYRMDYKLVQACQADAEKFCHGEEESGGAMHECLRRSRDFLSEECRNAEDKIEELEHEDVRLNPRIMKACPLAINTFCSDIEPGGSNVLSCLQRNVRKSGFPQACRDVLLKQIERSSLKYSLNVRLKEACDPDLKEVCPNASASARHPSQTILGCVASKASQFSTACQSELAALLRIHLYRFQPSAPLTCSCDEDVKKLCEVDSATAPHVEPGYVQTCLMRHIGQLQKPCWALLSVFDDEHAQQAVQLEGRLWNASQETAVVEKMMSQVRQELEFKLAMNIRESISSAVMQHAIPYVRSFDQTTRTLVVVVTFLLLAVLYLWRRSSRDSGTVVMKDGRA